MNLFLPVNMSDVKKRQWDVLDFVLVTGDAYVDHPSFGAAIISRLLESLGYRVGIIAQPDWTKGPEPFMTLGRPELAFLVTSGNIDSMVAHYTSLKKKRREDLYSPGGKEGRRPDRALIVYTSAIRQAYKNIPVVLGGLEASLRRLSHYDYWSDSVRRSVLADSKADLLVYGMGEKPLAEIAERLRRGENIRDIKNVRGTVYRQAEKPVGDGIVFLHPFEEASRDKRLYAENFAASYRNTDHIKASVLAEKTGAQYIIQNKPSAPLESEELDKVYSLPFTREEHPSYLAEGGVPALKEISFSITSSRGCFGACSFCSLAFHQGRAVRGRSHDSILREAEIITAHPEFKGYIHDVGGPTANFRNPSCRKQIEKGCCERRCLTPTPCKNLEADHKDYITLLRKLRKVKGVKKVFIRSGIRFDYLLLDPDVENDREGNFLKELCEHHISGQLKVAPEHVSDRVLSLMGKSPRKIYDKFVERFDRENRRIGKKQFLVPYFISAHPGSTLDDAIELALYLKKNRFIPDQVQDFYPTPGTLSTCMFYTGLDPLSSKNSLPGAGPTPGTLSTCMFYTGLDPLSSKNSLPGAGPDQKTVSSDMSDTTLAPISAASDMKKVYIPSTEEEKRMQKALIHFHKPGNYFLVKKALEKAERKDLIGNHPGALIPSSPPVIKQEKGAGKAAIRKKSGNRRDGRR